jgi:hypothetical protein
MNSENHKQRSWKTTDNSPWWIRGTPNGEPNGDYSANCYMNLGNAPINRTAEMTGFNDHACNYHSKSYYCQASDVPLTPKHGSPEGCICKQVTLTGKYSAGSLIKCTGCLRVSKSTEKNSCPVGTKLFSPRNRADWKTVIASAAPLRSPAWIIDVTQAQNGCQGCTKHAMNSNTPAVATWMTAHHTPWYLRSTPYSEPNGDYKANCYLDLKSAASEDSVTFNDHSCKANSDAYYCQPVKEKKKPVVEEEEEEEPSAPQPSDAPAPAPAVAMPQKDRSGRKGKGKKDDNNNDNENENENDDE